ncbi:hypothetical protein [Rodentibacter haemolyticus]|uniref:CopG-like ribbon-helix-helix domain-containing protein n=1 Tax=Rodentibacter haemolyticus TaxID=2778911 RepID=A0ABX6UY79_9PAST|nr:hypothetical protein [Rodentibacter haemolyticus]QPB43043.1 hypothetical protein IHV77_02695 [Rodentibacter haemolyticus]
MPKIHTQTKEGRLQIVLEPELLQKVKALAKTEDRTISSMGRILINQALNSKEKNQ